MSYLNLQWGKNDGNHTPGVIFVAFIIAVGLAIGLGAESNAQFCGDVNGSQTVNISDIVYLMYYLFNGGSPPVLAGDANCDAATNVGDAVYIISYVFKGGKAPCHFEP